MVIFDVALTTPSHSDHSIHRKEHLDKCANCHPQEGFASNLVAGVAQKGAKAEAEKGTEGLLVSDVQRVLVVMEMYMKPVMRSRDRVGQGTLGAGTLSSSSLK